MRVRVAIVAVFAASAGAQVATWLPGSDIPLSLNEIRYGTNGPIVSSACCWDVDGTGAQSQRLVIGGALNFATGNQSVAYLDEAGWHGLPGSAAIGGVYSMLTFRAPGRERDELYVGTGSSGLYRFDGSTWVQLYNGRGIYSLYVCDFGGAGPGPEKLYIGGADGLGVYDGTSVTVMPGSPQGAHAIYKWKSIPGDDSSAVLLVDDTLHTPYVRSWNGTTWSAFVGSTDGIVRNIGEFDLDGDGPNPPELLIASSRGVAGKGPLVVRRNGAFVDIGPAWSPTAAVDRFTAFDPDGDGPIQPWLVISGVFESVQGVAAHNVAYRDQSGWHAFPAYWLSEGINVFALDRAPFSDSPQLVVVGGGLGGRPCLGRFALSNEPPAIAVDPQNTVRASGSNARIGVIPVGDELTFRWYKGTVALNDGLSDAGSTLSGVYGPRLTIANLTSADVGEYQVQIGNAYGVVRSAFASVAIGCAGDFNADNGLDVFDYLDFIDAFTQGRPAADFNLDDSIDFFDYLDFVNALIQGC